MDVSQPGRQTVSGIFILVFGLLTDGLLMFAAGDRISTVISANRTNQCCVGLSVLFTPNECCSTQN